MSDKTTSGGTSIFTVVQIIFIVLKLLKVINWSWWKVLIPTWVGLGISVIMTIIILVIKYYDYRK